MTVILDIPERLEEQLKNALGKDLALAAKEALAIEAYRSGRMSLGQDLVMTGAINVLQPIFGEVLLPPAVLNELQQSATPEVVRIWLATPPIWLRVAAPSTVDTSLELGAGEVEAICLAREKNASYIVLDDLQARRCASAMELKVVGTLGILAEAADRQLVVLADAFARLEQVGFRVSRALLQRMLDSHHLSRQRDAQKHRTVLDRTQFEERVLSWIGCFNSRLEKYLRVGQAPHCDKVRR